MQAVLLIDFGSTFTKVVLFDLGAEEILGAAKAKTTVESDITIGLKQALAGLRENLGTSLPPFKERLACSSAAGGLRMVAVGLVPELTAEAARRAALGAGARVLGVYSYALTRREVAELEAGDCDILLLAGGTDGGDTEVILHNARALAESRLEAPIVVAGNKVVAPEVEEVLRSHGKEVWVTENVLPELGKLNIDPARESIRQVFMRKIVDAKGLRRAEEFVGKIVMPTPAAVLEAAVLLGGGTAAAAGMGDLLVVDVGGATTDVHSFAEGRPTRTRTIVRGLPEPLAKRTVEGDLGLRVSALSLLDSVGTRRLLGHIGLGEFDVRAKLRQLAAEVDRVPASAEERAIDRGLAQAAVELAVERHVGFLQELYTPAGLYFLQEGKDLTETRYVIGTGGVFQHHPEPGAILSKALYTEENPLLLKPRAPELLVDRRYVLWAAGLLKQVAPEAAFRMMRRGLCAPADGREAGGRGE